MLFKWEKLTIFAFKPYHGLVFLSYWLFATYWSFVFSSIGFYLAFLERIYANQMVICYFTIKLHKYSSWHGQQWDLDQVTKLPKIPHLKIRSLKD